MALTKVTQSLINPAPAEALSPIPTDTASAIGEFKHIESAAGAALALPAGGTWAWHGFYLHGVNGTVAAPAAGVSAGEAEIFAILADHEAHATIQRIA